MVRTCGGEEQLRRCTLDFRVKFDGWQEPERTNDQHIP